MTRGQTMPMSYCVQDEANPTGKWEPDLTLASLHPRIFSSKCQSEPIRFIRHQQPWPAMPEACKAYRLHRLPRFNRAKCYRFILCRELAVISHGCALTLCLAGSASTCIRKDCAPRGNQRPALRLASLASVHQASQRSKS